MGVGNVLDKFEKGVVVKEKRLAIDIGRSRRLKYVAEIIYLILGNNLAGTANGVALRNRNF